MEINLRKAAPMDGKAITDIFNYYSENGFASFFELPLDDSFYKMLSEGAYNGLFYVIVDVKEVIGFALLKRFHKARSYDRTAEITYFIHHKCTHKGYGKIFLDKLEEEAKNLNIDTILAKISSLNPESLAFHKKNGFTECGRFIRVARKYEKDIDLVWMQKFI
jgi:L-amino acid N-acyltransferase YncA